MKLPVLDFHPNSASLVSEYLRKFSVSLNGLVMQDQDFHRDSGHKDDKLLYVYACCEYIRSKGRDLGPYDVNHLAWKLFGYGYKREAYELLESDNEFGALEKGANDDHPLWDWARMKQLDGDHDAAITAYSQLIPFFTSEERIRASAMILIAASLHLQGKYSEAVVQYEQAIKELTRLLDNDVDDQYAMCLQAQSMAEGKLPLSFDLCDEGLGMKSRH